MANRNKHNHYYHAVCYNRKRYTARLRPQNGEDEGVLPCFVTSTWKEVWSKRVHKIIFHGESHWKLCTYDYYKHQTRDGVRLS